MAMGKFGQFEVGTVSVDADAVMDLEAPLALPFRTNYLARGMVLASVFITQSVRTRTTFERAAISLGMDIITVVERRDGEPLEDFGYAVTSACDLCVARLEDNGDFNRFAKHARVPVIDGGCGSTSHPTQALIDVFTLMQAGIKPPGPIATFGPANNRAMQSFYELAGRQYSLLPFRGRYSTQIGVTTCKAIYCVTAGNNRTLSSTMSIPILHPFPRGCVVPSCYDFTDFDLYHKQMDNAVPIRRRILEQAIYQNQKG